MGGFPKNDASLWTMFFYCLELFMKTFITMLNQELRALVRDEKGLSVTEYAVAGGLVAAVAAAAFSTLGTTITSKINAIASTVAAG
jgi:pilus assembly protein Flp/PilA